MPTWGASTGQVPGLVSGIRSGRGGSQEGQRPGPPPSEVWFPLLPNVLGLWRAVSCLRCLPMHRAAHAPWAWFLDPEGWWWVLSRCLEQRAPGPRSWAGGLCCHPLPRHGAYPCYVFKNKVTGRVPKACDLFSPRQQGQSLGAKLCDRCFPWGWLPRSGVTSLCH